MISRLWLSRKFLRIIPWYIHSGVVNQHFKQSFTCLGLLTKGREVKECSFHRFSTMSEAPQEYPPQVDFLTFFKSTVDELQGPNHCWLNKLEEGKVPFGRDGPLLVLAGVFLENSLEMGSDHVLMVERVKYLQRRYPKLSVFGYQCDSSIWSVPSQTHVVQTIMKEYLTFPILLSNKKFAEIKNGACYLLFKDLNSRMLYYEKGTEIGTICKVIEEFNPLHNENSRTILEMKDSGTKPIDVIKEPCVSSYQNLSLYYPGCISADEDGNRLFLSDSNHHRIIILDSFGKIIDCIGSSPGFEDGDFESAKLLRPGASLYDTVEDCLYFVDSENHAIRRADMGRRTLETIFPSCDTGTKFGRMWRCILDKLGIGREVTPKSEEIILEPLVTPWHLMKSKENNLLIVNRSFRTLWIMDPASGKIEKVITGYPNIMEICGQMIIERLLLLKQIYGDKLKLEAYCSTKEGFPDVSLMSSFATFHNEIIICDSVGQAVLKINRDSGVISNFHLSNFGILGLPYWLTLPLEKVFIGANKYQRLCLDHLQCFSVLPGRCDIQVNIDIPVDTELAGPLQKGCIWCQARGSAAEVSGYDGVDPSTEKVGVAQQWFDELDNLAFSGAGTEADDENGNPGTNIQEENRVQIKSSINISPGTSEVIIYAVLYLQMKREFISHEKNLEQSVKRILNVLNSKSEKPETDACIQLMLKSSRDIGEVVFMKPLHLRLEFDCLDHPKADKANEVVLTDSTIEVNVSLK